MHSSSDIPDYEPPEITQNETVKWNRRDLSTHYPAATWTLTYYFVGPTQWSKAATADGSDFAVVLSATETQALLPGRYTMYGRVAHASNGEVYKVYGEDDNLVVNEDPAAMEQGQDQRSWARICRDNLRAAIQGTSDSFILNYSIAGAGRTIGKMGAEERIKWLNYFDSKVLQEDQLAGRKSGKVLIRFSGI